MIHQITLDSDKVVELLNRAVEEKGVDYVYEQFQGESGSACVYALDGQPSCLVGHVINYLGRLNLVAEEEPASIALADAGIAASGIAIEMLSVAQRWQDDGRTWGEARDKAVSTLINWLKEKES